MTTNWRLAGAPAVRGLRAFRPEGLADVPERAAAYLRHAIEPGTRIPRSIRLRMHGHIRLGVWLPFTSEQTIDAERGFWWRARVAGGLLTASDSFDVDRADTGASLGGIIPLFRRHDADVVRSAFGRYIAERACWMPTTLLPGTGTHWRDDTADHGGTAGVALGIAPDGRLCDVTLNRWGRDAGRPSWIPFGMVAEDEDT